MKPPRPVPCGHRGALAHATPCSCNPTTKIKVHECPLHQLCVPSLKTRNKIKDGTLRRQVTICANCNDYQEPEITPVTASHPLAKHITGFAVGITSAYRARPTVVQAAQSIVAAGFAPTIFAEPGTNGLKGAPCPIVHRPEKLGAFHNYLQTLRDLLASDPQAQAIVIFQDDVLVARGLREFLEHDLWPSDKCGGVSLYSPNLGTYEGGRAIGFNHVASKYLVGACGMVYPRHVAEALVTRHTFWRGVAKGPALQDETQKKAVDTWIGHAIAGEKLHVYFPNPSLCQHIATTSALGHGGAAGKRRSGAWGGEAKTPHLAFASNPATLRFNTDGSMRLADPLSVVIPAWNCFDLTEKCLRALAENADVSPLDVIYIDNGSEPGVVDQVKQLARDLQLELRTIQFATNRGFCPAANAGMEAGLQAGKSGYILLLNNDCYIHAGCLSSMIRHMRNNPKAASCGPLTADQGCQSIARNSELKRLKGQRRAIKRSMLVGFCQLKSREALRDVGLLDPNLPHGLGTDDDWAARAKAKGYQLLLACDAFADHDHKSTFRRSGQDRRKLQGEAVAYLKDKGTWPRKAA